MMCFLLVLLSHTRDSFRHFWIISSIRVDFLFFTHRESSLSLARAHNIHSTRKSKLAPPVGLEEYIVFEKHAKNDDCFFRSKHERDGIFIFFFFFCHDDSKKWRTRRKWKTSRRRNEIFIFTFVSPRGRKQKQKKIDKIDGSSSSSR